MTLEQLDLLATQPSKAPDPWTLKPFDPVVCGNVLAFDQALANTGWCLMRPIYPYVIRTGVIRTDTDIGHEGNLSRTILVHDAVKALIDTHLDLVVHETPPVGPGMYRPESSLLAATAIRIAAHDHGVALTMAPAQRAKVRLTGDAQATKADIKAGIKKLWPHLPILGPWNEHVRDAIALGIVAMEAPA